MSKATTDARLRGVARPRPPGSAGRWLTAALALWAAATARGQSGAAASQAAAELPPDVCQALAQIEDFAFEFGQPGFYVVLEHLRRSGRSPGWRQRPLVVENWRTLLERPAEFRGLPITVEGVIGRNSSWQFVGPEYAHLGRVWQLELHRADQPIACTVILTNPADDLPLKATVRVTGYFVMIRQYYSRSGRVRQAALLVADGPTLVAQPGPPTGLRQGSDWLVGLLVVATAALVIAWVLLRRSLSGTRRPAQPPRAGEPAPVNLAEELRTWAGEQSDLPGPESADAEPHSPEADAR